MTKESIKNTINLFEEILSENIKKRHLFFDRAEQIVLWIVGFSTATIVLLFSNGKFEITNFQKNDTLILMIVKNLLLVCCFGLSFRILSFLTELLLDNISRNLYAALKGFQTFFNIKKNKFENNENAEEIIKIINYEFDWDLKDRKELNDDPNFIELLKEIYEKEFESKEEINRIQELFLLYYGYKSSKLFNFFQQPTVIYTRGWVYKILFNLTLISFALTLGTLIFLCIQLLKELN